LTYILKVYVKRKLIDEVSNNFYAEYILNYMKFCRIYLINESSLSSNWIK